MTGTVAVKKAVIFVGTLRSWGKYSFHMTFPKKEMVDSLHAEPGTVLKVTVQMPTLDQATAKEALRPRVFEFEEPGEL